MHIRLLATVLLAVLALAPGTAFACCGDDGGGDEVTAATETATTPPANCKTVAKQLTLPKVKLQELKDFDAKLNENILAGLQEKIQDNPFLAAATGQLPSDQMNQMGLMPGAGSAEANTLIDGLAYSDQAYADAKAANKTEAEAQKDRAAAFFAASLISTAAQQTRDVVQMIETADKIYQDTVQSFKDTKAGIDQAVDKAFQPVEDYRQTAVDEGVLHASGEALQAVMDDLLDALGLEGEEGKAGS